MSLEFCGRWFRVGLCRLLTGSGQQCVLLHTPSATCALEPADWGKPSWSREHLDTPTSAGTGTDTPPAGPLGAWDATENTWNLSILVVCGWACMCSRVSVLYYIFWLFQYSCVPVNTRVWVLPGCMLALSAVLTQQTGFKIYGSAGVRGAWAVCERGPCVFITLPCRISPNT